MEGWPATTADMNDGNVLASSDTHRMGDRLDELDLDALRLLFKGASH